MKITVKIEGQSYEVEIEGLYQRPVIAWLEGERFEVWPEGEAAFRERQPAQRESVAPSQQGNPYNGSANSVLRAPIPGLIASVAVQTGEEIAAGQEICVLEAMKMKNTLRAPRDGRIAAVKVRTGQQVGQGEVIVAFEA